MVVVSSPTALVLPAGDAACVVAVAVACASCGFISPARQGLTLVHFSARHKRLLWDTLGGWSMEFQ